MLLFSFAVPFLVSAASVPTAASGITLQFGQKNVAVATLQNLLVKKGYLVSTSVTGYFGPITQSALKAFQKANNLPQTGLLTISSGHLPAFFAAAGSSAPMGLGTTNAHVKSLQASLVAGGYLKLNATTNYFGSLTQKAVISFQKAHGLPQTGVVDATTFAAMNKK